MKDAVVGKPFPVCEVELYGERYAAIKLAGPEAICAIPSKTWDYRAQPIGPGTLGWGRTLEEVEEMRDNYYLTSLTDIMKVKEWHERTENKGKICPLTIGGFRIKPSGIYGGCAHEGNIFEGCRESKRMDINLEALVAELKERIG